MVLQNCELCTNHWRKNGYDMQGYQCLRHDQHIPNVFHPRPVMTYGGTVTFSSAEGERHGSARVPPSMRMQRGGGRIGNIGRPIPTQNPESSDHVLPNICNTTLLGYYKLGSKPTQDANATNCTSNLEDDDFTEGFDSDNQEEEGLKVEKPMDGQECPKDKHVKEIKNKDSGWYLSMYKAVMAGDFKAAKQIFSDHEQEAPTAKIRNNSDTALHVIVGNNGQRAIRFVRELLEIWPKKDLMITNNDGCTPLAIAAKVGNVEAAKLLLARQPTLVDGNMVSIADNNGAIPLRNAAEHGHKAMFHYLLEVMRRSGQNQFLNDPNLFRLVIEAEFYDAALLMLTQIPKLATSGEVASQSLITLAQNPSAFSCYKNGFYQRLINKCSPKPHKNKLKSHITGSRDIEKAVNEENETCAVTFLHWLLLHPQRYLVSGLRKVHHFTWTVFEKIVPLLNHMKHEKWKGHEAKQLVKYLCRTSAKDIENPSHRAQHFIMPLLIAAENGIYEIVKEILDSFPDVLWYKVDDTNNKEAFTLVFRLAIINRYHEIYRLLPEMEGLYVNIARQSVDKKDETNILHLAGDLAPSNRLRALSGAALQMQRELQWFKEIESLVHPAYTMKKNLYEQTPQELFTKSHQKLMEEGERWMRDTATSCTVVATLIATIVFAAAITVPGGNSGDNGKPMLRSEKAFTIFAVADALSLFTSCISILMFLSILTSRYAQDDFLKALPTRLIIGLLTLFISVASMMAAFSSTLYLTFGERRRFIVGCVVGPSCLIVAIFASMQFKLLVEMINSTYRCPIFKRRCKKRNRMSSGKWWGFEKKSS